MYENIFATKKSELRYVYFYVRRHKLWSFNVAIVLAGSEEEMKQLANGYETGNWSPFGETDGKVGEEKPGEAGNKDEELHAVIATKPPSCKILQNADKPKAKTASTKKGR